MTKRNKASNNNTQKYHTWPNTCVKTYTSQTSTWKKNEVLNNKATGHKERDWQIRNSQLTLQWEFNFQKIAEGEILCRDHPWTFCDQKCVVSLLYLGIGTKGRRLLPFFPRTTIKLWRMKKIAFIQHRNLTLDHCIFFSRKQKKLNNLKNFTALWKNYLKISSSKIVKKTLYETYLQPIC